MSGWIRAFLAFDLDDASVRKKLTEIQSSAVGTGADLKLVEPENIHVTVRFLGDISASNVDRVYEIMQTVNFSPFVIRIFGIGVFPSLSYPRVLWAGITAGGMEVESIYKQLEADLRKLGVGADERGFSPHLTIARLRSGRNKIQLTDFVSKNKNSDFGEINASCLKLKRSELTPRGPVYSTLKEYCP